MPRPAVSQVCYGLFTVVVATMAMLLLSGARSLGAVALVALAALALGLLAALTIPVPRPRAERDGAPGDGAAHAAAVRRSLVR
jgi:hypothetical protein